MAIVGKSVLSATKRFLPGGAAVRNFSKVNTPHTPTVAIIDCFTKRDIPIDRYGFVTRTHGEIVETIIRNIAPNAKIKRFNIEDKNGGISSQSIISSLKRICNLNKHGQKIDAVNMSFGCELPLDALSHSDGMLTRSKFKNIISDARKDPYFKEQLKEVGHLSKEGTQVFVSAGNDGPEYLNLTSLGKGAHVVGATDSKGDFAYFSETNPAVTEYNQGMFNVSPVKNKYGELQGYDITGSKKPEIPVPGNLRHSLEDERLLGYSPDKSNRPAINEMDGTSFACPKALAEYIKTHFAS